MNRNKAYHPYIIDQVARLVRGKSFGVSKAASMYSISRSTRTGLFGILMDDPNVGQDQGNTWLKAFHEPF